MKQFETILNLRGKKQIIRLLDKTIKVREKSFIKDFNRVPISLYNEAIQLRNEVKELFLTKWVAAVDQFLKGEPIGWIEPGKIEFGIERIEGKPESVIKGRVGNLLYLWLWHLVKGDLIVRECEAGDCPRIFTPAGRKDQSYCSNRCRMRIVMRRIKKRKELRARRGD
ncbi:hypothetical protein ES702_04517 [subsurface metagenome]